MYQLLKGVQYLHHNNIIHRDIKCANILINNRGQIKIGDFGLARNITPNHTKEYTYKVVTLWFRAPELLFGEKFYGTAIDVWSCGCVFGELLTGKCPFQGKDEEALVNKICEKCGTPNETNWPGVTKLPLYNKYIPRTIFPNSFNETYKNVDNIDEVSLDLFSKMLQLDPKKRITIDEALKHPFFHDHQPSMCTAKEMPKFDREYHEFEYSRYHKKIKEEGQKVAKGDYMNKQNIHNNIKNSPKTFFNKNNNINNKEFHNNFLGKKHYQDKNNYNNNRNYKDRWGDYS
jgi:cyclin-dependent kinase 12/13